LPHGVVSDFWKGVDLDAARVFRAVDFVAQG
jgi:hypothetical protein